MQIISNQVIIFEYLNDLNWWQSQAFTKENTGLLDLLQVITTHCNNLCNQLFLWNGKSLLPSSK